VAGSALIVATEAAWTVAPLDVAGNGPIEVPDDDDAVFGDDEPEVAMRIAAATIAATMIAMPATMIGRPRMRSTAPT
jgi:hypothetical protein